jgi:DNA-binding cell septation regulator SpoVG
MKIERMNKGIWGKIRAFFDLQTEDGFTIKGFKMVEGTNGMFVGFPSHKNNDDEYHDTVWADKDVKDQVTELAKREYENPSERQADQELPVMNSEDVPF